MRVQIDLSEIRFFWIFHFITDQLGSVVAMTDSTGTLLSQSRYLPFGQVRTDVGSITQTDIGYTGQRDNSYINLMDYHSRWYDDSLGRFIQPDSIIPDGNPQSLNRFSYVGNNPINFTDPSGHTSCSDIPNEQAKQYCEDQGGVPGFGIDILPAESYGITLSNGWSDSNKQNVMTEVATIAKKLTEAYSNFCGAYTFIHCETFSSSASLFSAVLGGIAVTYDPTRENMPCDANTSGQITCGTLAQSGIPLLNIGPNPLAILYHQITAEFGHVFNARLHFDPSAEEGNSIWIKNGSRRPQGYIGGGIVQPYVHHTFNDKNIGCGPTCEDYADMFMNYIYSSFSPDDYGDARYAWMNQRVGGWIYTLIEP